MARSDKSATVAELADELRGSTAVVLTEDEYRPSGN